MDWLNYHHLYYFWTVAREGSIAKASEVLLLAQPTISGQIKALEQALSEKLFERSGRNLVMTSTGKVVYSYAEEIFGLGRELQAALKGKPRSRPMKFMVGIDNVLPKLIVHRLLAPVMELPEPLLMICREANRDQLLVDLATHKLDLVLSDAASDSRIKVRARNHLLGECGIAFFAAPKLAATLKTSFPECLDEAPFLLPAEDSTLRSTLEEYFDARELAPQIYGEFDDMALLKMFGKSGIGIFAGPRVIETEICELYDVTCIGRIDNPREKFYAVTLQRTNRNPAVAAIYESAKTFLEQ